MMMRLTRRDWALLERVPTAWWENWLESLGYRCTNVDDNERDAAIYRNRNLRDVWLPLDKSMGDYCRRLVETFEDVAAQNPERSILCELVAMFISGVDRENGVKSDADGQELAEMVIERLGAHS